MHTNKVFIAPLVLLLSGCGTTWDIEPPKRAALEQVLISIASDRAAESIVIKDAAGVVINNLPQRLGNTFVDGKDIITSSELYALHAIERYFLDAGVPLVDSPEQADTIVKASFGALAMDTTKSLLGIPSFNLPIPAVGNIKTPDISIYRKKTFRGIAKIALSIRDAKAGVSKAHSVVNYGTAEMSHWTVLLFLDAVDNDLGLPKEYDTVGDSLERATIE